MNPAPALAPTPLERCQGALYRNDFSLEGRSAWQQGYAGVPVMSSPKDRNHFSELFGSALRRRLYPYTGLQRKVLAGAIGVSTDTLDNWVAGRNEPSYTTVMTLIEFFDCAFASEISGGVVTKIPSPKAAEALKRMNEAHADLRAALGG